MPQIDTHRWKWITDREKAAGKALFEKALARIVPPSAQEEWKLMREAPWQYVTEKIKQAPTPEAQQEVIREISASKSGGFRGAGSSQSEIEKAVRDIEQAYPKLKGQGFNVIDSRHKGMQEGRQLEFYPPDERDNPTPGKPTIEVFNPKLTGEKLKTAIYGDMLHHLPNVDKNFAAMRDEFRQSITPEQLAVDQRAYERERRQGETRNFNDWFAGSRQDAYIRGYLAPDEEDAWKDAYTPQQRVLLDKMKAYISK